MKDLPESKEPTAERISGWITNRERRRGLRPRDAAILIGGTWLLTIIVFGVAEHLIDKQTFPTIWLGMWWALQTVTTVGYGDIVPIGTPGRIVASFLLLGGLAFLTVIIAMITSGFVARAQRQGAVSGDDPYMSSFGEILAKLEKVEAELAQLRKERGGKG